MSIALMLLLVVATSCGREEAVQTPAGLLSAEQVGGTAVEPARTMLVTAGPDTVTLFGGKVEGMAAFEREAGDAQEEVVLKVRQLSSPTVELGFRDVEDCLADDRGCRSLPLDFERERVEGLPQGSVGFASRFRDDTGEVDRSYLRSYTYVDGQLVMVSLLREDGSDPEVADLVELTELQLAKTEAG